MKKKGKALFAARTERAHEKHAQKAMQSLEQGLRDRYFVSSQKVMRMFEVGSRVSVAIPGEQKLRIGTVKSGLQDGGRQKGRILVKYKDNSTYNCRPSSLRYIMEYSAGDLIEVEYFPDDWRLGLITSVDGINNLYSVSTPMRKPSFESPNKLRYPSKSKVEFLCDLADFDILNGMCIEVHFKKSGDKWECILNEGPYQDSKLPVWGEEQSVLEVMQTPKPTNEIHDLSAWVQLLSCEGGSRTSVRLKREFPYLSVMSEIVQSFVYGGNTLYFMFPELRLHASKLKFPRVLLDTDGNRVRLGMKNCIFEIWSSQADYYHRFGSFLLGNKDGGPYEARFNGISCMCKGPDGSIFVGDEGNRRIRQVNGKMSTTLLLPPSTPQKTPGRYWAKCLHYHHGKLAVLTDARILKQDSEANTFHIFDLEANEVVERHSICAQSFTYHPKYGYVFVNKTRDSSLRKAYTQFTFKNKHGAVLFQPFDSIDFDKKSHSEPFLFFDRNGVAFFAHESFIERYDHENWKDLEMSFQVDRYLSFDSETNRLLAFQEFTDDYVYNKWGEFSGFKPARKLAIFQLH